MSYLGGQPRCQPPFCLTERLPCPANTQWAIRSPPRIRPCWFWPSLPLISNRVAMWQSRGGRERKSHEIKKLSRPSSLPRLEKLAKKSGASGPDPAATARPKGLPRTRLTTARHNSAQTAKMTVFLECQTTGCHFSKWRAVRGLSRRRLTVRAFATARHFPFWRAVVISREIPRL